MYLWHDKVHDWNGESLIYVQLTFTPVYRRDDITEFLYGYLREHNVTSFCIYEIYGLYDILLRAWLPRNVNPQKFYVKLEERSRPLNCINVHQFYVERCFYHWLWPKLKDGVPTSSDIRGLTPEIISQVNAGTCSRELLKSIERKHLAKLCDSKKGIKFFVIIPSPAIGEFPTEPVTSRIFSSLRDIIVNEPYIVEPSMYTGTGFAWTLLKGKITQIKHYGALSNLVHTINLAGVDNFSIKTLTYLVTGLKGPLSVEREEFVLEDADPEGGLDPISYITRSEDAKFEVKASFKIALNRYLRSPNHEFVREAKVSLEGVLRAIVGFLNSGGGTILIGLLEKHKYTDIVNKPDNLLSDCPIVDDHIICGINWEYNKGGWDAYVGSIANEIRDHIGKNPAVNTTFRRIEYEGRDLCLIRVPRGDKWYYIDESGFYVREVVSTILLEGDDRDTYQGSHPR